MVIVSGNIHVISNKDSNTLTGESGGNEMSLALSSWRKSIEIPDLLLTKLPGAVAMAGDWIMKQRESILNEIFAHSILGKHPNILRYHGAWTENKLIFIQNEFCVGGNLEDLIIKRKSKNKKFSQEELYAILVHVSKGLRYIHSLNLAHLNLKSATVLIQKEKMFPLLDGGIHGNDYGEKRYTYKIGDTGHVTNVENPKLEKGDFRYLPREIQKEDFSQVTRADIFSLALTLYEAATLKPLPKNGPVWHSIRDSNLDKIEQCDQHFNDLLKMMVHSNPSKRPSAATILSDQYNFPLAIQSKSWLIAKLQEAQQQKDLLTKRLEESGVSLADTVVEKQTPLNE
uniref:Protein kinase domain-containing protein n=1 Tax=Timema tahoe TaxID=61484 RepID=A0A7R9NVH1_9NEOP|nr:unnamed protein product [Timema tahoe]